MSDQQKESIKLDAQFETTKGLIIQTIKNSEKSVNDCMRQKDICIYHWMMIISTIAFLLLTARVFLCEPCKPAELEVVYSIVLKMFSMLVLSLLFIWWMKFLSKLISDCREAIKPWQKKVSETYSFLVDMEMLLHKAIIENEKKKIEKDGQGPNPVEMDLQTNKIKELVKREMENVIKESIVEKAIIDWTLNIKQENKK